ncbi:MAG: DNA-binding protein [Alphaproteobacteria bacterium]|nr:MAG: DNA-binding protein [Alphaproteobacteria bacterium]
MSRIFIRKSEVLRKTGAADSTLYYWIKNGTFPKPYKIGERASAWLLSEVEEWMASRTRGVK